MNQALKYFYPRDQTWKDCWEFKLSIFRDLGIAAIKSILPSGGLALPSLPSNLNPGVIKFPNKETGASMDDSDDFYSQPASQNKATSPIKNKQAKRRGIENPLEQFASYTTVFTFACLKKEEVNNPYLYRTADFAQNQVVFSSAGRYDKQRVATAYGTPEYFIDNLVINSVIAPNEGTGASNAVNFDFDVYEPYSAGLFLQSLAVAANVAGFANYLDGTPYVLKMEFFGYKEDGSLYAGVQPKYFVMTLKKVTFTVTEGGSTYKVSSVPYNHAGFSSLVNTTYNDIAIIGSTVEELLAKGERSLQVVLNQQEAKRVTDKLKNLPDVYEIHFPETPSSPIPGVSLGGGVNRATTQTAQSKVVASLNDQASNNPETNPIGSASFGFKADSGGNYVAPRAQDVVDEASGKVIRDKITIDPKTRTFQYAQGQTLTAIISQAILSSDYGTKAISEKPDGSGRVNWFRIDAQIQLLEYDAKIGDYAKRYIYRVALYKVHSSVFTNPNAVPAGYDQLSKSIVKQYDYIYTGQNNDILKFNIDLNMAFYTAISPTAPQDAGRSANQDSQSAGQEERNKAVAQEGDAGTSAQQARLGGLKIKQDPNAIKLPFGGSGQLKPEELVANNFHLAFLQNGLANLVNVDLEILGDPYWLTDNGIGGYLPPPGATEMITIDGSANYESGDIYVYLRFRSPVEPKESNGDYLFVNEEDSPFSGIYKVTKCENKFSGGTFKQTLKCVRMPLQVNDFIEPVAASPGSQYLYDVKEPVAPTNDIYDY